MSAYAYAAMAGLQVMSGLQQAEITRMNSQVQQQLNEMNAKWAEVDAYEAEKFGYTQAAAYGKEIDQTISEQRVTMAAQGVDVNYGTAAEIQAESKLTGFLNDLDIKNTAYARAQGLKREARGIRLNSSMQASQANINAQGQIGAAFLDAAKTGLAGYTRK